MSQQSESSRRGGGGVVKKGVGGCCQERGGGVGVDIIRGKGMRDGGVGGEVTNSKRWGWIKREGTKEGDSKGGG